jgi:poly(3-hydroxybutyrate) depolymerase
MRSACATAIVIVLIGCNGEARKTNPTPVAAGGGCTLTATNGLKTVTVAAPGPGGPQSRRTYELYVPAIVDRSSRLPLVVSLHGTGATGAVQASLTHWTSFSESLAQSGGSFIVAFPDGAATLWLWGTETSYDVKFIFDVVKSLEDTGCVQPSAVYVDGWSEGAYMAQRMACASPDAAGIAFAAIHGYAGGNPQVAGTACDHPAPTHILLSQGLDDRIIDPQKVGFAGFTAWIPRYRCYGTPDGPFTEEQRLSDCIPNALVVWWPIEHQGHLEWSCTSDATWHTRGIWRFFRSNEIPAGSTCS